MIEDFKNFGALGFCGSRLGSSGAYVGFKADGTTSSGKRGFVGHCRPVA